MEFKLINRTLLSALLAMTLIVMTGCSGKYKVAGKVIFDDDDSPVTSGVISFYGNNVIGSGRIQPDGSYSVGVKTETDGIPKGEYTVTIMAMGSETIKSAPAQGFDANVDVYSFVPLIDAKYGMPSRSGLTATVPSEDYTFHVKRASPVKLVK